MYSMLRWERLYCGQHGKHGVLMLLTIFNCPDNIHLQTPRVQCTMSWYCLIASVYRCSVQLIIFTLAIINNTIMLQVWI